MAVPDPQSFEDGEEAANLITHTIANNEWKAAMDWLLGITRPIAVATGPGGDGLPAGTFSAGIAFNSNLLLRGGMVHSTSTNNHRFTVPDSGTYRAILMWGVTAQVTTGTGRWFTDLVVNGTTAVDRYGAAATPSATFINTIPFTATLTAGDYIEFRIQNSNAGAITLGNTQATQPRVMLWLDQPA